MTFTPRSAKNAKVRYGNAVVTCKKWTVTPEVSAEADVTNFESSNITGPDGQSMVIEQVLGCAIKVGFTIELDADAAANLYDANITPGNSNTALKLYLNGTSGPFWNFPTPYFKSVPMDADVKGVLKHTITGTGNTTFLYPTGSFT